MFTKKIHYFDNKTALRCAAIILVLLLLGLSPSRVALAQQPGGREALGPVVRPKVRAHRSAKRPVTRKPALNVISLLIVSTPSNSRIFVDGEPKRETDAKGEAELSVTAGSHVVKVARDGYVTQEAEVEIDPTLGSQQEGEFKVASAAGGLNIVPDPAGAEVYLDETYKGTSNSSGLLVIDQINPAQSHKLRITKTGYVQRSDIPVTTYGGQISVKLLPESVRVRVTTDPPESEIYFDDVYKGSSTSDGVLIMDQVNPNQPHRLRGKKAGYIDQVRLLAPNS